MIHRSYFVLSFLLVTSWVLVPRQTMSQTVGEWSRIAKPLSVFPKSQKVQIEAPDKRTVAVIEDLNLLVLQDGKKLPGIEDEGFVGPAELGWSSDSKGFFVTWSDGGTVGTWQTFVYLIEEGRVSRVNVSKEVERDFKKSYECFEAEAPNIAGLNWLHGSRRLLLVAEVPPHSSCPQMGLFAGYIVSVPGGKIIERLNQRQLTAAWADIWEGESVTNTEKRGHPLGMTISGTLLTRWNNFVPRFSKW